MTKDEERFEVLNVFFASVFNNKTSCPKGIQPPELEDTDRVQNEAPIIQEGMVSKQLCHLDLHKPMGPDGIHPRVVRKLVKELTKSFSIIYQKSWSTREVTGDWK